MMVTTGARGSRSSGWSGRSNSAKISTSGSGLLDVQFEPVLQADDLGERLVNGGVDGGSGRRAMFAKFEQQLDGANTEGFGQRAHGNRQLDDRVALARHGGLAVLLAVANLLSLCRGPVVRRDDLVATDDDFGTALALLGSLIACALTAIAARNGFGLLAFASLAVIFLLIGHVRRSGASRQEILGSDWFGLIQLFRRNTGDRLLYLFDWLWLERP